MRRTRAVLTTVVASTTVFLFGGGGSTVLAGHGNPNLCEVGEICLYENLSYNANNTNHLDQWTADDHTYLDNEWWDVASNNWSGDIMNDETSSLKNRHATCGVYMYSDTNHGGRGSHFSAGVVDADFRDNYIGDNAASSHNLCA